MNERSGDINPDENRLPFNIQTAEILAKSGKESDVYFLGVEKKSNEGGFTEGVDTNIVLKENRLTELADDKEMQKLKAFYDFIKNDPDFGKFVVESSFVKAQKTESDPPRAYVVQKPIQGKRVEALSDQELYNDRSLLPELLEFVNATIKIIKKARETDRKIPDLYSDTRYFLGNFLHNPRYSGNVVISDRSHESAQRVHFVDVGQVSGKAKNYKFKKILAPVDDPLQLAQLRRWRDKISKLIENKNPA